jgi:hypothetical protein
MDQLLWRWNGIHYAGPQLIASLQITITRSRFSHREGAATPSLRMAVRMLVMPLVGQASALPLYDIA